MGGKNLVTDYGRTVIDGASIKTGTIDASKLTVGEIITKEMIVDGAVSRTFLSDPGGYTAISTTTWTEVVPRISGLTEGFQPLIANISGRARNPVRVEFALTFTVPAGISGLVRVEMRQGTTSVWAQIGPDLYVSGQGLPQSTTLVWATDGIAPFPLVAEWSEARVVVSRNVTSPPGTIEVTNTSLFIQQVNK